MDFELARIETYTEGCDVHFIDDIVTVFDRDRKLITITFKKSDLLVAAVITSMRILDDFFNYNTIIYGSRDTNLRFENEEQVLDFLFYNNEINNHIHIYCASDDDFRYARSCLVYKITPYYEDTYYMNKEIDR